MKQIALLALIYSDADTEHSHMMMIVDRRRGRGWNQSRPLDSAYSQWSNSSEIRGLCIAFCSTCITSSSRATYRYKPTSFLEPKRTQLNFARISCETRKSLVSLAAFSLGRTGSLQES